MIFGIAYLPHLMVTGRYRYGLRDRFGFLPEKVNSICAKQRIIWVHAVSVGEMKAAGILAPLLRKAFPSHTIVFSTVTHTGNKVAKTIATEKEGVFYLPFDISFITDRVVKAVKPEMFISMETEFWPNLVDSLYKSGARLILANGRISNRSYPRYKKGKFFISRLLKKFSLILMQSDRDAARIIALGAPKEKVSVTGNLKFDIPLLNFDNKRLELRKKLNLDENEILIVAGSTHKGEEEAVVDCFARLKKEYNNLRLLIAPRHIERAEEIEKLLTKNNFKSMRISIFFEIASSPSAPRNDKVFNAFALEPIFILDTVGELRSMYSAADIVFVGGSLVKKGGQNPIEPASLMKPIIFGKYTFNFQDVIKIFLENDSGVEVEDKEGLYSALKLFLDNPGYRKKLGVNARDTIAKNSGSSQRTIDLILTF
jgi:3-deoxy-D-manno-octulosonic-acid transferase